MHEFRSAQIERRNFAASVMHELRTPLAALASEVEIALRRNRTPAAYREALMRVAQQAAELIELTGDLALFANPAALRGAPEATTDLQSLLRHVAQRFDPVMVIVGSAPANVPLAGDVAQLTRALQLILEHAVRYRGPGSPIKFQIATGSASPGRAVDLLLDASTPGFTRTFWHYLIHDELDPEVIARSGWMRLQTAACVIRLAGGSVAVEGEDGNARVRITLLPGSRDGARL